MRASNARRHTLTRPVSRLAVLTLVAGSTVVAVPVAASAAPSSPSSLCSGERHGRAVKQVSVSYTSLGTAAGKYNASGSTEPLTVTMSRTKTTSSAWQGGGGVSVDFGIASVEAKGTYTVTKATTTAKTVTDQMNVASHHYGYAQPKTENRTFHIYDWVEEKSCHIAVINDYGNFKAITAYPFYAECVATSPCTPKP